MCAGGTVLLLIVAVLSAVSTVSAVSCCIAVSVVSRILIYRVRENAVLCRLLKHMCGVVDPQMHAYT